MKKLLIQGWSLEKDEEGYHIAATHYIYIKEIVQYYSTVCLLAPVKQLPAGTKSALTPLKNAGDILVHELPYSNSYISAIKNFKAYVAAYKQLQHVYDRVYVRYPTPFGWLGIRYFKDAIIHFVGDPIDAAQTNPNFGKLKKATLISMFMPEHLMYMQACKKARVLTNGFHLQQKLKKYSIRAEAVISSTLNDDDFYMDEGSLPSRDNLKILYAGYLRKAKGVEVLIEAFAKLIKDFPTATFTIVGSGESEAELKAKVSAMGISQSITFTGHVDKREELNQLFRTHNLFAFASFSEGSPRVVLEAMANGLNVVSTPVGSLPTVFKDGENIVFAEAGNPDDFHQKISTLVTDHERCLQLKKSAFEKAKTYTTAQFIKNIFQ
ncbi:glycosyltransferase family 4 protein [Mucilaginibacter celer]|uniref:Glycosyltransferase n=1 Tax=Mucilaginibacter celer TaxID=2305508 RepID=A0A494VVM8_9SPHI|nr:glycosyltransferase family 4 protein [Mucilaginibacter celer]AYL98429.1 glycosyltransferase [Mucilaginibacter celer]